jgi:hypothetical protein
MFFWIFVKDLEVPWGCNSAILVRNEITSLSLYHIWKILYQRNLPKWCSPFYDTPADGLFSKNIEIPKRCVFVGVCRAKIQCNRISRVAGIANLVQTQMENIYWKHVLRNFWDY